MDYIESLNDAQKEIAINATFLSQREATCIIACAGAGKTKTLIAKIIYMIKELDCDPKDFFITTFTRNAANELKERLLEYITEDIVNEMTLGTFHSIAYSKINDNYDYPVEDNIESYLYKYCDFITRHVNNKDIVIERQDEIYDSDGELIDEERDIEHSHNDISDFSHEYQYIFIDEYQDVNDIQEQIIDSLYKKAKLLITVGDDQQNIYTFRDTKIKYILEFAKRYDNAQYKYLIKNYRCNTNCVTLANAVLSYNNNKIDKTIKAMKDDKPKKIMLISFKNQKTQIQHITKSIINNDVSNNYHKIAILARNNGVLKKLETTFASLHIPTFYIESGTEEKQNIQDISGRIILSTIHGTKGLEFDTVYIIDVNNGTFPSSYCADIEEERRLFYVGITRSKKKLFICYDERQPSIFIAEIKKHTEYKQIINYKTENNGNAIIAKNNSSATYAEDYSVNNIMSRMNYLDFEDFRCNIFNYHTVIPSIVYLHSEIPKEYSVFCQNKNLVLADVSTIFNDFLETYILRTIQHVMGAEIENLDYTIYVLHCLKNNIQDIRARTQDNTIEKSYGINIKDKSDEEIERLILYYQSGVKISSYIDSNFMDSFANAYENYKSDKNSNEIIYDIFIVSLIKGIFRGRNSILQLINFNKESYINEKINNDDLLVYNDWLMELEDSYMEYFKYTENINTSFAIFDKQSKVKCILDMQCDDTIIKIKSNSSVKPQANTLIQTIANVSLAKINDINIQKCSIYNPLSGHIHTWDLSDWDSEEDVIYFLTERFS